MSPEATGAKLRCPGCGGVFFAGRTDVGGRCPIDGTPLVLTPPTEHVTSDPFVGTLIDNRYRIEATLGAGSMGTVYRAKQLNVGREVAVKVLRQDRTADDTSLARFKREAELIAKLSSPHTVTAFDSGLTADGEPFLVMELLRGESLGQRIARARRIEVADALDCCMQVLRSLSEAHAKGIVHRDLKPDNVYFAQVDGASGAREIVKVLDFGIAKLVGRNETQIDAIETQAGAVFGTPRYMSPEQAQGLPLDARSDLYTLGTILYQMIAGRPVFDDQEAVVVMARHIKTTPTPLRDLGLPVPIPDELDELLGDVLAKDPNKRPRTADAFAERLLRIYEAHLADSSGIRIARAANTSSTTSASFVSVPMVATDPPTIPTSALSAPGARFRKVAIAFLVAASASGFLAWRVTRGPSMPSALEPSAAATQFPAPPALAPVAPVVDGPTEPEPTEPVPRPSAVQGTGAPAGEASAAAKSRSSPPKAGKVASPLSPAPSPPQEAPAATPSKPSNGYGIFE